MTTNLSITTLSVGQTDKETTINDAVGALDAAITASVTFTWTGSDGLKTASTAQTQQNAIFVLAGSTSGTPTFKFGNVQRGVVVVRNTQAVSIDVSDYSSATTITVAAGEAAAMYVSATGIYALVSASVSSGTNASTTDVLTGTSTTKFTTPDAIAALWEKGSNIASSGTISVGEGGYFHITGTTTITDIDWATPKDGRPAIFVFDGALTLTHNGTTLLLPGGVNITTAAGDTAIFVQDASDNVKCVMYQRGDGTALVSGGATAASTTEVLTGTDTSKYVTSDAAAALWEKGSNVASAATISLGEGGYFRVTGTTTITDIDFATAKNGRWAIVNFNSSLTLTHNETTLRLPGAADIVTLAGDTACFVQDNSDNVFCVWYQRANGTPLVGSGAASSDYEESVVIGTTSTDGNITLSGEQTIQSIALVTGDRVLLTAQTNAYDNRVWIVNSSAWTIASGWDVADTVTSGKVVPIEAGDNAGKIFQLLTEDPITLGTTDLSWSTDTTVAAAYFTGRRTTTSAFTLALTDKNAWLYLGRNGAQTISIPLNASVNMGNNTELIIQHDGASGTKTINCADPSIMINGTANGSVTLTTRGDAYWLKRRGSNAWVAVPMKTGTALSAASTTEVLTGTSTAVYNTPDATAALWEQGSDIASAGMISVGEGGYFHITGTATITDIDFGTDKAGRKVIFVFDGALTLTHNGTTLILPTGANITTAAGDSCVVVSEGSDAVRVVGYTRADGTALVSGGGSASSTTQILTGTDTSTRATPDAIAALWEKGSDIASAATISIGEGGFFHVTGTATITDIDFGTDKAGRRAILVFDGALTLTHNATTLILPGGANITTAAGDSCEVVSEDGTDNVRVVRFTRASGKSVLPATQVIAIAVSDETTSLTTGTAKTTFRMPFAFTLTDIRASVTTAPTGGTLLTVDVNEAGSTILSTKLTFDASEKTTTTAATPRVISDSSLADDAEMTIDIDAVGSTIAGAGLKVYLIGYPTAG